MNVIFFGSSKYVLPTIEMLHHNFDLSLIITTEKRPTDAVPAYALQHKIPFISVDNLKQEETLEKIKNIKAEVGILGYFRCIIPQQVLEIFPKGIVNIHPSLLPKYRGPTPVQSAILNGDEKTGTTIILLDSEVDHGPTLSQKEEPILPTDTTETLHQKLFLLGADLIKEILPQYMQGKIVPHKQNHAQATFTKYKYLTKTDGQIDTQNPPSKEKLDRMIRALYPWPGIWAKIKVNNQEKILKFLPEQKFQFEGKKPMTKKDFINGYPTLKQITELV